MLYSFRICESIGTISFNSSNFDSLKEDKTTEFILFLLKILLNLLC